jgi:hypothetical protein
VGNGNRQQRDRYYEQPNNILFHEILLGGLVVASSGLGQINREDFRSMLGDEFAQDTKQG